MTGVQTCALPICADDLAQIHSATNVLIEISRSEEGEGEEENVGAISVIVKKCLTESNNAIFKERAFALCSIVGEIWTQSDFERRKKISEMIRKTIMINDGDGDGDDQNSLKDSWKPMILFLFQFI